MILEITCVLTLVIASLLVGKHPTTLSDVTGPQLKEVWASLTVVTELVGCDRTILDNFITGIIDDCRGDNGTSIVEDEDGKAATIVVTPTVIKI